METVFCSYCGKVMPVVKNGTRGDIQRYKCKKCGHSFILQKTPYTAELKYICKAFYRKGVSYRKIAEIFLIKSHNSVANWCTNGKTTIDIQKEINTIKYWIKQYTVLQDYYKTEDNYNELIRQLNFIKNNDVKKFLEKKQEEQKVIALQMGEYEINYNSFKKFPVGYKDLISKANKTREEILKYLNIDKNKLQTELKRVKAEKNKKQQLVKKIFSSFKPDKYYVKKILDKLNEILIETQKIKYKSIY